jgi:hypothetical protein
MNVWKPLKKLLYPLIIDDLVIAAARDSVDHKVRDPWATPGEFSNQVHG